MAAGTLEAKYGEHHFVERAGTRLPFPGANIGGQYNLVGARPWQPGKGWEAGALGAAEQAAPTDTVTSLDGALSPEPLVARTRTKYVPAATFVAISVVGEGLVGKRPMLEAPAADPASTT